MSLWRRPRGTYVRNTPDFFSDYLAICSVFAISQSQAGDGGNLPLIPNGFDRNITLSIFNNDTTGRAFFVYGIAVGNDAASTVSLDFYKGTFGTFQAAAVPPSPLMAAQSGLSYYSYVDSVHPTIVSPIANPIASLSTNFEGPINLSPFPLFVIPTGWSLRSGCPQRTQEAWMTVWYTQMAL